ncbi:MAG: sucrose phosphorylase, partial [Actinomycetota bacterium]
MRNGVHLITYVDRLGGGDLSALGELLTGPLQGVFTGVHLLPFFHPYDGADAGFDPIDHTSVDPRLGGWEDVARLGETHDVTADLIVNHISRESPRFLDYLLHGDGSPHAGMFLAYGDVFPDGATEGDLVRIYRPRPGLPFTAVTLADGSRRLLWTTFTSGQIDLDVSDPGAMRYLGEVLDHQAGAGVRQVRLDAVGYAVKTPGTSCFMTDETRSFIRRLGSEIRARGMESLLEIHSHYSDQVDTAATVDRVYDFALPPLVLFGLYTGSAEPLRRWLEISPRNAVTVLDTHDGIGVIDIGPAGDREGLLSTEQIDDLVEGIHSATGGESRLATGAAASNLDLYQVNSTYYSALGGDGDRYLLARLLQLLCPGIPQVYYAGLLAMPNDMELLSRTGVGRDINRPYLDRESITQSLERPVVRRLLGLIRFRNTHPAFGGRFHLGEGSEGVLHLRWEAAEASIDARLD